MNASDQRLDIIIRLLKEGSGATQASSELGTLDAAQRKTAESSLALGKAMRDVVGAVAGMLAFGQVVNLLQSSIKAFEEQDIAIARLNGSLRAAGRYTEDFSQEVQDLSGELQKVTRFGDEKILDVSTLLIQSGAARQEVAQLTELVLDLSSGLGMDLNSAAMLVGKTLQGELGALGRYGIQVDETKTKSQQLEEALATLEKRFGGLARTTTETLTGNLEQLKNVIGDIKELLGENFLSYYNDEIVGLKNYLSGATTAEKMTAPTAEQNDKMRASFEASLKKRVEDGRMQKDQAEALRWDMMVAFIDRSKKDMYGFPTRDLRAEAEALMKVESVLLPKPAAWQGPLPPSDFDQRQNNEKTAVQKQSDRDRLAAAGELQKLMQEMSQDTLVGFDKERAAALQAYNDRVLALEKIQATGEDVTEGLLAAEEERSAKINAIWEKESAQLDAKTEKQVDAEKKAAVQIAAIKDELRMMGVAGYDREFIAAEESYNKIIEKIQELAAAKRLSAEEEQALMDGAATAYKNQIDAIGKVVEEQKRLKFWASDTGQLIIDINKQFAAGASRALVEFASGSKKAEEAFKEFGASFLQMVAQMILQFTILNMLKGLFGWGVSSAAGSASSAAGSSINSTFTAPPMTLANGGMVPRLMAEGGFQSVVSSATYLPRFNAIAGEAGAELLTVMARPRMFDVGGMTATVGDVGGSRMAMLPERALAGLGGAENLVRLVVEMQPGLQAQIIEQSAKVSVERVQSEMGRRSPLSTAVQKLVA